MGKLYIEKDNFRIYRSKFGRLDKVEVKSEGHPILLTEDRWIEDESDITREMGLCILQQSARIEKMSGECGMLKGEKALKDIELTHLKESLIMTAKDTEKMAHINTTTTHKYGARRLWKLNGADN